MTNFFFLIAAVETQANNPVATNNLSLLGWMFGFLVAAGVLTLVAWPLLNIKSWTRRKPATQNRLELDTLYDRLETEQLALDELEFDLEAGGLTEADYNLLKTNSQAVIQALKQEIESHAEEIGDYSFAQATPTNAEQEATSSVTKITGPISVGRKLTQATGQLESELHRRRNAVKIAMHCSECQTPFKPGDRFCVKCGAPLPIICQSCGAELSSDDRFCAKCGATVHRYAG